MKIDNNIKQFKKTSIVLGYTCNNNCIFCCISDKRNKFKDKSTKEILNDIYNASKRGSNYIEFIGGEPTIRKDIFNLISYAKKLNFSVIAFATNGRLLSNKKFAKKVIESGVNHIIFSIHGHNAKLHDSLTQVKGSFFQLIKGISNLKELGFKNIGTNTTIVCQNYKYILKIAELIYNLGIRCSEFIYVDPVGSAKNIGIVPTYESVSPYVNEVLSFGKSMNIKHWFIRYYPLCFINQKYHNMVSEIIERERFKSDMLGPDFINNDVIKGRKTIGRTKLYKCNKCKFDNICEGYWKDYPFFESDFNTILKLSKKDDFYLDKLYFLLGLKRVLRVDIKNNLSGFEKYHYVKDKNYSYIARTIEDAKLALTLTKQESTGVDIKKTQEKLGELYGYPKCCSEAFFNNKNKFKKGVSSQKFKYKKEVYQVLHYPCREGCAATNGLKEQIKIKLKNFEKLI
jgi:MoaA/NifB/PqqE/SkfB family radical SAM enzyme